MLSGMLMGRKNDENPCSTQLKINSIENEFPYETITRKYIFHDEHSLVQHEVEFLVVVGEELLQLDGDIFGTLCQRLRIMM